MAHRRPRRRTGRPGGRVRAGEGGLRGHRSRGPQHTGRPGEDVARSVRRRPLRRSRSPRLLPRLPGGQPLHRRARPRAGRVTAPETTFPLPPRRAPIHRGRRPGGRLALPADRAGERAGSVWPDEEVPDGAARRRPRRPRRPGSRVAADPVARLRRDLARRADAPQRSQRRGDRPGAGDAVLRQAPGGNLRRIGGPLRPRDLLRRAAVRPRRRQRPPAGRHGRQARPASTPRSYAARWRAPCAPASTRRGRSTGTTRGRRQPSALSRGTDRGRSPAQPRRPRESLEASSFARVRTAVGRMSVHTSSM